MGVYLEAGVLVRVSAQVPARVLAGMRKERQGTGHIRGAEIIVFNFGAFEGDALELVDRDLGERRTAEQKEGRIAKIDDDKACQQDQNSA
jgi:hypothetical protein